MSECSAWPPIKKCATELHPDEYAPEKNINATPKDATVIVISRRLPDRLRALSRRHLQVNAANNVAIGNASANTAVIPANISAAPSCLFVSLMALA
jgi:hypothetical protein